MIYKYFINIKKQIYNNKLVSLIILFSFINMLLSIMHNYPFIMHPDEPTTVKTALDLRYNFGVERFDWGHLGFYYEYVLFEIFIKSRAVVNFIGLGGIIKTIIPIFYEDSFIFYFIARLSTVFFSLFTLIFTYKTCRLFFNKSVSTLAITFLALSPYFIKLSAHAVYDPPQLALFSIALFYFLQKSFVSSYKNLFVSAIFIALSASYKINIVIFVPFLFLANLLLNKTKSINFNLIFEYFKKGLVWTFIFLIILLSIHYTIFTDFDTFWSLTPSYGFLWQIKVNSAPRNEYDFVKVLAEVTNDILRTFSYTTGLIVVIFVVLSIIYLLTLLIRRKFNNTDLISSILILALIVFILTMSRSEKYRIHYLFPTYPLFVLTIAYFINSLKYLHKIKYIWLIVFLFPIYLICIQTIQMNRLSTTSIVTKEMLNNQDLYYYNSDNVGNLVSYNYIEGLRSTERHIEPTDKTHIIISDEELNLKNHELIKVLDNKLRMGSKYYYYLYRYN